MYLGIIVVICIVLALSWKKICGIWWPDNFDEGAARGFQIFCWILGFVFLAASFVATGSCIYRQKAAQEKIVQLEEMEAVYANKAENLAAQFTAMVKSYIGHEKAIFKSISPGEIAIYFAKYPELRGVEALTTLVAEVKQLETDKYNQQLAITDVRREMRVRQINPWIWYGLIPDIK